jgi:hypothetical protein
MDSGWNCTPSIGEFLVAHAHDLAVLGPGGDREVRRAAVALDRQRVVAVDGELLRQAGEHAFARGRDLAGLAVHQAAARG